MVEKFLSAVLRGLLLFVGGPFETESEIAIAPPVHYRENPLLCRMD